MLKRLKNGAAALLVASPVILMTGCVTPPQVTSKSWQVTWPQVSGAAKYEVYVDAGDGSAAQLTSTESAFDANSCAQNVCHARNLGTHARGVNARVRVITVGTDGSRSEPSTWVPLFEEGSTPVLSNLHARTRVDLTNDNQQYGYTRLEVTGKAAVRNGLFGQVTILAPSGDQADQTLGSFTTPWSGPQDFTFTRVADPHYRIDSSGVVAWNVATTVLGEAVYRPEVLFDGPENTVPIDATDRTPPSKPVISMSGSTLHINRGTDPAAAYRVYLRVRPVEDLWHAYNSSNGTDFPIHLDYSYPGVTQVYEMYVVGLDETGNWASSAVLSYTP